MGTHRSDTRLGNVRQVQGLSQALCLCTAVGRLRLPAPAQRLRFPRPARPVVRSGGSHFPPAGCVPAPGRCAGSTVTSAAGHVRGLACCFPGHRRLGCPGRPLQRRRCFASVLRADASAARRRPWSLCQPGGPDGEARPQARPETRAANFDSPTPISRGRVNFLTTCIGTCRQSGYVVAP